MSSILSRASISLLLAAAVPAASAQTLERLEGRRWQRVGASAIHCWSGSQLSAP